MNKLRIWLAYYIMPKDARKHFIKALSDCAEELEREVIELSKTNAGFYTIDDIIKGNEVK